MHRWLVKAICFAYSSWDISTVKIEIRLAKAFLNSACAREL